MTFEAVSHNHVLKDRFVGVKGHLGLNQSSEVGGEVDQAEVEEVLASSQCKVPSGNQLAKKFT